MPTAPVTLIDGGDILDDAPPILPPLPDLHDHDQDVHDIDIHAPSFSTPVPDAISVLSIHDSEPPVYYNAFPDCNAFSHPLPPYPYCPHETHVSHPALSYALHNDSNSAFVLSSPHLSPKHLHHSQDLALRGASSLYDSRFHLAHSPSSFIYLPPLHDLTCSLDQTSSPFAISSSLSKPPGLAHTLLPPIVQSNPAEVSRADIENRPAVKRTVAGSPSQIDPYAADFLRDQLGEAKWNTFCARLFERRLGPVKSKIRVRNKNASDDTAPPPGATAIDFLVKVEVVKEVLRTYVPHPYNPLKSLTHPYPHSPSGSVTLTRSTILVLSGWSNTQFSYWARRSEGISVLAAHDERLRAVAIALQKRINAGGVLLDGSDEAEFYSNGCPNVTGKGLDIIIEEVKKRTGLSPFLRGKHSSLDPFGSTNSDKDAGPGPPPYGAPAAPIYMPTFQAMEYSHVPAITTTAESPMGRRPKKKRRISIADSVSSYGSSIALKVDPSDEPTNHFSLLLSENPRLTPDQESVSSSEMQPISPPSITLPQLLDTPRIDENGISPYELSLGMHGTDDGREYFPVSHSRSDLDNSDVENFSRKRYCGMAERNLEKRPKLSA